MLRTLIQAGAIIALLTGAASAQMALSPFKSTDKRPMTDDERQKQQAAEKAYKSAMDKIPEKKPVDPWGNIRPNPPTASQNKQ